MTDPIARLRQLAEQLLKEAGHTDVELPADDSTGEQAGEGLRRAGMLVTEAADALVQLQQERDDAVQDQETARDQTAEWQRMANQEEQRAIVAEARVNQLTEYMESARVGYEAEKEARQKATQERDKWFIECERLANGLLEQYESMVDDPDGSGELAPDRVVDQVFEFLACRDESDRVMLDSLTAAEARVDRLTAALREEWWMNHGCRWAVYGDDGEMQCGMCFHDFKREPIEQLQAFVTDNRLKRIHAALAPADPEPRHE